MASILDFNFNNEYSAKAFKTFVESDPTVNNRKPHTFETLFGKDNTDEADVSFLIENVEVNRLGSLGASDMPTPFKGFRGTKMAKQNFPYFVEGWHSNQDEAMKLARLIRGTTGRPSDNAILQQVLSIYRRTNKIVEGMRDVREYMLAKMCTTGAFTLQNADEYKRQLTDSYNYDVDGTWATNNVETLTGNDVWSDTVNSDPIADLIRYDKKLQLQGARLEAMILNQTTFGYFLANQKIKNYAPIIGSVQPGYIYSQADVERILSIRLNHEIKIFVDDEVYVGWDDTQNNYYPENQVTLIGKLNLGTMWAGLTYEEAFNATNGGNAYRDQARLADGIVVSEYMKQDPDEKIFRVSQSCVPSFEGMKFVYNLKWTTT